MPRFTLSIRSIVLLFFTVFIGVAVTVASYSQSYFSQRLGEQATKEQFAMLATNIRNRAQHLYSAGMSTTELLANSEVINQPIQAAGSPEMLKLMATMLTLNPQLYSVHVANSDDSYEQLTNLDLSSYIRRSWQASPQDRWLEMRVVPTAQGQLLIKRYLDKNLNVRREVTEQTDYRPTQRFWYQQVTSDNISLTKPYRFRFTENSGISMSKRAKSGQVVGVAIALSEMIDGLQQDSLTPSLEAFLFDQNGQVLGQTLANTSSSYAREWQHSEINLTAQERAYLTETSQILVSNQFDYPPFEFAIAGEPQGYFPELLGQLAKQLQLDLEYLNGASFQTLFEAFTAGDVDVLSTVKKDYHRQQISLFTQRLFDTQIIAVTSKDNLNNIRNLEQVTAMHVVVVEGYVLGRYLQENYPETEFSVVNSSLEALRMINAGEADIYIESQTVIEYLRAYYFLNQLNVSDPLKLLSSNQDFDLYMMVNSQKPLLHSALNKAISSLDPAFIDYLHDKWIAGHNAQAANIVAENSDAGLFNEHVSEQFLQFALKTDSVAERLLTFKRNGVEYYGIALPLSVSLLGADQVREFIGIATPKAQILSPIGSKVKAAISVVFVVFLLAVLLVLYAFYATVMSVSKVSVQLKESANGTSQHIAFSRPAILEIERFSRSLNRTMASLHNKITSQFGFLDSLNQALKAPVRALDSQCLMSCDYHGALAQKLCDRINHASHPAFSQQQLSRQNIREIEMCFELSRYASLYGPVTTKLKQTKLQAGRDRINELRMRFEVLWRDLEINYLQECDRAPDNKPMLLARLNEQVEQLKQDFLFLCRCNLAEVEMDKPAQQKLLNIGMQKWVSRINPELGSKANPGFDSDDIAPYTSGVNPLISDRAANEEAKGCMFWLDELHALQSQQGVFADEEKQVLREASSRGLKAMSQLAFPDAFKQLPSLLEIVDHSMADSLPKVKTLEQAIVAFSVFVVNRILACREELSAEDVERLMENVHGEIDNGSDYEPLYSLMIKDGLHLDIIKQISKAHRLANG